MKIKLRAHHLLCLSGFQGYGYSREFTKNMEHINNLRKLKTTEITVCDETDDICRYCPNLKGNICENNSKNQEIIRMDREVLSKLNDIQDRNLFNEVLEKFNTKDSVSKICFNCKWHEECLFYKNLK